MKTNSPKTWQKYDQTYSNTNTGDGTNLSDGGVSVGSLAVGLNDAVGLILLHARGDEVTGREGPGQLVLLVDHTANRADLLEDLGEDVAH